MERTKRRNNQVHNYSSGPHTPLSLSGTDGTTKPKISKDAEDLNNTVNQQDSHHRAFHPTKPEYIFFSNAYRAFTNTNHILGQRKKISTNLKEKKSYRVYFLTIIESN